MPGFAIDGLSFLVSLGFFTLAYIILDPLVLKISIKYIPAIRGGVAFMTTLLVLILTNIFTSGLTIDGITAWIIAPLIIWLSTVLAGILLPLVMFKNILENRKEARENEK